MPYNKICLCRENQVLHAYCSDFYFAESPRKSATKLRQCNLQWIRTKLFKAFRGQPSCLRTEKAALADDWEWDPFQDRECAHSRGKQTSLSATILSTGLKPQLCSKMGLTKSQRILKDILLKALFTGSPGGPEKHSWAEFLHWFLGCLQNCP